MIKFYRGLKDSYSIAAHGSDIYFATDTLEILHGGNSYSGLNKDKTIKDIGFANGILTITYTDGSTNELDSNLVTKTELSDKVDKVSGKQLSTNDFTNELKTKLENSNVYKHQFRTLSALPASGDGWYSIASIGDTESSIVQISSGGHTDVQVAINTGWAGSTTGSLTVLNSFIDDTNGNHAFVKAVRLRKIPNSKNGTAVLEAKINRTGYYTYALYVNIVVSVFTNAGHNIITTNSESTQALLLVTDDSNLIQEFTLTDKAIMAKNIVAEKVTADNIIENIVVNGQTYPAAKNIDLGNILSEGLTVYGTEKDSSIVKSITSNSIILSSKSGLYVYNDHGTPVLEIGTILGDIYPWQIGVGTGLEQDGTYLRADFNAIIGVDDLDNPHYFNFTNAEKYITLDGSRFILDLSKIAGSNGSGGSGIMLSSFESTDLLGPYNRLYIGGNDNPLTFDNNHLYINTHFLIGTNSTSMIQVPDAMVDVLDDRHIKLKVPEGSGGIILTTDETPTDGSGPYNWLLIGGEYENGVANPLEFQANHLRINPQLLIGTKAFSMIQVPDSMVDEYDATHIKLKVPDGSGSGVGGTLIGTSLDATKTASRVNFLPDFWKVEKAPDEFNLEPRFRIATELKNNGWDFGNYNIGTLVIPPDGLKHLEDASYELVVNGVVLSTGETLDDGEGPYNWLKLGGQTNNIWNPLTYVGNRLFIDRYSLIGNGSDSMIQVPDSMIDTSTNEYIKLRMPEGNMFVSTHAYGQHIDHLLFKEEYWRMPDLHSDGTVKPNLIITTDPTTMTVGTIVIPESMLADSGALYHTLSPNPSIAVNGGLVVENGELMLSTDILGYDYNYQIKIGSGLQVGNDSYVRVNPLDIIGNENDCSIIIPSENFTRDGDGKAHLIFNTGISKDELDSAIDARLKELGLIE